MTVAELIAELQKMPQEAEANVGDGVPNPVSRVRLDPAFIWPGAPDLNRPERVVIE